MIVVVALPAAWVSEEARRQRDAAAMVCSYGIVWYEEPSKWLIIGPIQAWTAKLLGDDFAYRVVRVRIDADRADDFTALGELPHIESADLGGYTLNGAALADISNRMPKLRKLWIWEVGRLTAADLLCLRRSPQLRDLSLNLGSEDEGDELLEEVSQLGDLRSLAVSCPRLTANIVRHLSKATALECVGIGAVDDRSPVEFQRLRNALPRCEVYEFHIY
jgi:hypothetical protein